MAARAGSSDSAIRTRAAPPATMTMCTAAAPAQSVRRSIFIVARSEKAPRPAFAAGRGSRDLEFRAVLVGSAELVALLLRHVLRRLLLAVLTLCENDRPLDVREELDFRDGRHSRHLRGKRDRRHRKREDGDRRRNESLEP